MSFSRRTLAVATVVILLLGALGGIYARLRSLQAEDEARPAAEAAGEDGTVESARAFGTDIAIPVTGAAGADRPLPRLLPQPRREGQLPVAVAQLKGQVQKPTRLAILPPTGRCCTHRSSSVSVHD